MIEIDTSSSEYELKVFDIVQRLLLLSYLQIQELKKLTRILSSQR